MKDEIKEISDKLKDGTIKVNLSLDGIRQLEDYITNLQDTLQDREEYIGHLEELCDKYEEEHSTTFEYWKQLVKEDYKSRNEKANTLLDELLERAYIDGEYIMYDYSTSELLEVKQALQGEDKDE